MGVLTHLDSFTDQKALKKTKKRLKVGSGGGRAGGVVGGWGGRVQAGRCQRTGCLLASVLCPA
jgi:hypothetical protein